MKHMIALSEATWEVTPYTKTNGIYCALQPDTLSLLRLVDFCRELSIISDPRKFHVTVCYSPTEIADIPADLDITARAYAVGLDWWPGHDDKGYLCLKLESHDLHKHHQRLLACGAKHTFSPYVPHVTLMSGMHPDQFPFNVEDMQERLRYNPILLEFNKCVVSDMKD